jgi:16S rRNA G966 N2-methylase RsmD
MRIISGTKRGMTILPPKSDKTRPITDRVKESIFDVLYKYTDRKVLEILRKNIDKAGFTAQSRVVCANAFKMGAPAGAGQKCSLVFVDPPYEMSGQTDKKSRLAGLLEFLPMQLANDGLVVVRTEKRINLLDSYGSLRIIDKRVWSSMAVAFLALKKDDQQTGSNTNNSQTA